MYFEDDEGDAKFSPDDGSRNHGAKLSNDSLEREMLSRIKKREEEMEALRKLLDNLEQLKNRPKPAVPQDCCYLKAMWRFAQKNFIKVNKVFLVLLSSISKKFTLLLPPKFH